jgi:hypothetical protein
LKPGKPNELTSYRPISIFLFVSEVFEKLLLKWLLPMVENNRLIPNHQFGFRHRHSTIEQTHRILQRINETLENKQFCSAALLDISQAFDKVWHTGLLYKLGSVLRSLLYLLYTANLSTSPESITATFADDTAVLATDNDSAIASHKLQTNLAAIQNWFKKWRMNDNGSKSIHVTFTK